VSDLIYHIEYSRGATENLSELTAAERMRVLDTVDVQLTHEPTVITRNRKLMRPNPLAGWELRIGTLRVYYDVDDTLATVTIIAVGTKLGNQVRIGGEVVDL